MKSFGLILFVLLFCSGAILLWRGDSNHGRRRANRFLNRNRLTIDEFVFQLSPARVNLTRTLNILHEISSALDIHSGQLRPTDRISVELAPEPGWEHDDTVLLIIDRLLGSVRSNSEAQRASNISTLGELIIATCSVS